MNYFSSLKFALCAALPLLTAVAAHGQSTNFYFRFDIGPAWSQETDLDEFASENVAGAELKFDTGLRLSVAGGYQVTDWFSAELETGFIYNSGDIRGVASDGDVSVSRTPILANVVFQCPKSSPFIPFLGAGIGGAASLLYADDIAIGTTTADGSFGDFVFAWQAFAGVRYAINEQMSLGLVYKYFYSGASDWEPDLSIGTSGDISADSIQTHSVGFAFNFNF